MLYTALKRIKSHSPCSRGWETLLVHLGKAESDNEPLSLSTILESNGLADAIWALRCIEGFDREIRLLACDFAEHVLPIFEAKYHNDSRPRTAIEVSRRYAVGEATVEELHAARTAARVAACAAWDAARVARAARDAAGAASAARDAAGDAASAAVRGAAWSVAWDAEREWQTQCFQKWLDTVDNLQEMKNEKG